jgi:hypothetical protein
MRIGALCSSGKVMGSPPEAARALVALGAIGLTTAVSAQSASARVPGWSDDEQGVLGQPITCARGSTTLGPTVGRSECSSDADATYDVAYGPVR